jgi:hypothetical protein
VPLNNSNVHRLPESSYRTVERIAVPTAPLVTIMNRTTGAGFYSDVWGPLPFALGLAPVEEYRWMSDAPNGAANAVSDALRDRRLDWRREWSSCSGARRSPIA